MTNIKTLKKDLVSNELIKELITIRIDTLYLMMILRKTGREPGIYDEGATGFYDNKGALFLPGGIVLEDSDRLKVRCSHFKSLHAEDFRKLIHASMKLDNATLFFPDGLATGVNLDNGFFANMASSILTYKVAARKKTTALRTQPPSRITSGHITRSNTPQYILPPYGARTKISSCLSVCLSEQWLYFLHCREFFRLHDHEQQQLWDNLNFSRKPVRGFGDLVLSPPYIIVCHTTRYKDNILCGLIRILGIGKFGEFATITIEEMTRDQLLEIIEEKDSIENYIIMDNEDKIVCCLLRYYPETTPGKRLLRTITLPLSPEKDVNIDIQEIFSRSITNYGPL